MEFLRLERVEKRKSKYYEGIARYKIPSIADADHKLDEYAGYCYAMKEAMPPSFENITFDLYVINPSVPQWKWEAVVSVFVRADKPSKIYINESDFRIRLESLEPAYHLDAIERAVREAFAAERNRSRASIHNNRIAGLRRTLELEVSSRAEANVRFWERKRVLDEQLVKEKELAMESLRGTVFQEALALPEAERNGFTLEEIKEATTLNLP